MAERESHEDRFVQQLEEVVDQLRKDALPIKDIMIEGGGVGFFRGDIVEASKSINVFIEVIAFDVKKCLPIHKYFDAKSGAQLAHRRPRPICHQLLKNIPIDLNFFIPPATDPAWNLDSKDISNDSDEEFFSDVNKLDLYCFKTIPAHLLIVPLTIMGTPIAFLFLGLSKNPSLKDLADSIRTISHRIDYMPTPYAMNRLFEECAQFINSNSCKDMADLCCLYERELARILMPAELISYNGVVYKTNLEDFEKSSSELILQVNGSNIVFTLIDSPWLKRDGVASGYSKRSCFKFDFHQHQSLFQNQLNFLLSFLEARQAEEYRQQVAIFGSVKHKLDAVFATVDDLARQKNSLATLLKPVEALLTGSFYKLQPLFGEKTSVPIKDLFENCTDGESLDCIHSIALTSDDFPSEKAKITKWISCISKNWPNDVILPNTKIWAQVSNEVPDWKIFLFFSNLKVLCHRCNNTKDQIKLYPYQTVFAVLMANIPIDLVLAEDCTLRLMDVQSILAPDQFSTVEFSHVRRTFTSESSAPIRTLLRTKRSAQIIDSIYRLARDEFQNPDWPFRVESVLFDVTSASNWKLTFKGTGKIESKLEDIKGEHGMGSCLDCLREAGFKVGASEGLFTIE